MKIKINDVEISALEISITISGGRATDIEDQFASLRESLESAEGIFVRSSDIKREGADKISQKICFVSREL